jgi:hypothetical protein
LMRFDPASAGIPLGRHHVTKTERPGIGGIPGLWCPVQDLNL